MRITNGFGFLQGLGLSFEGYPCGGLDICDTGMSCVDGTCLYDCNSDAYCGEGFSCKDGHCVGNFIRTGECICREGYLCTGTNFLGWPNCIKKAGTGACVQNVDCGVGGMCVLGTCATAPTITPQPTPTPAYTSSTPSSSSTTVVTPAPSPTYQEPAAAQPATSADQGVTTLGKVLGVGALLAIGVGAYWFLGRK